ncbi:hypothetical protein GW891_02275 [bacterium]|nr:hypothetical protein [bacterium]
MKYKKRYEVNHIFFYILIFILISISSFHATGFFILNIFNPGFIKIGSLGISFLFNSKFIFSITSLGLVFAFIK